MEFNHYDFVVIGSGPAGQKGAITAAKLGKKVAVIDRKEMLGGERAPFPARRCVKAFFVSPVSANGDR